MSESVPEYSIGRDYDPAEERLSADSDPREAFLTYLDEKHGGAICDMNFTLQDFRDYVERIRLTNYTPDQVAGFLRLVSVRPCGGREFSDSVNRKVAQP